MLQEKWFNKLFILILIYYDMWRYCMEEYLMETPSIDYMNSLIHDTVQELRNQSEDNLDYIKLCYSLSG